MFVNGWTCSCLYIRTHELLPSIGEKYFTLSKYTHARAHTHTNTHTRARAAERVSNGNENHFSEDMQGFAASDESRFSHRVTLQFTNSSHVSCSSQTLNRFAGFLGNEGVATSDQRRAPHDRRTACALTMTVVTQSGLRASFHDDVTTGTRTRHRSD